MAVITFRGFSSQRNEKSFEINFNFLKKIKNKLKIKTQLLSFDFRAIGASKKLA